MNRERRRRRRKRRISCWNESTAMSEEEPCKELPPSSTTSSTNVENSETKAVMADVGTENGSIDSLEQGPSKLTGLRSIEIATPSSDSVDNDIIYGYEEEVDEDKEKDKEKEKYEDKQPPMNILQRALSARSQAISNRDPGPPPDGGMKAWLQVLQAHLAVFNAFGYVNSYGIFEAYYVTSLHLPASTLAWPGSIQVFLQYLLSALSGRLFDAGYYRAELLFGFSLQILGVFSTSFARSYWQVVLAQGVVQGLGSGFVLCPTMSLVSTYFVKRRALAIAMVATGSATGGVVFPVIAQQLLPRIGFAWTVRVMGFVMLGNMAVILSLGRTRIPPRQTGPFLELAAFKEPPYSLFTCGMFCIFLALYFAFTYVDLYAKQILGESTKMATTILLVMNGIGVPGRILPALLADAYLGPLNTLIPSALCSSILLYSWAAVTSLQGLLVFAIIFGLVNSAVQGIQMSAMTSLTTDLSKVGTRLGMVLGIASIAAVVGPPIAGQLIVAARGSFLYTQIFGGSATLLGVAFICAARISETGFVLRRRM